MKEFILFETIDKTILNKPRDSTFSETTEKHIQENLSFTNSENIVNK